MANDAWPTFATLLLRYRKAAGLTQEQLAELASLSPRTISDLERGEKHVPRSATLQLLVHALRLSAEDRAALEHAARIAPFPSIDEPVPLATFVTGTAITRPYQFFGRAQEVDRIFRLLQRLPLQHAAISGPRRSGKTSLLYYLRTVTSTPITELRPNQRNNWLVVPERYKWIFVDFQDPRMGRQENLLRYLLFALHIPVPDPCDLERFLDLVPDHIHNPTVILLDEMDVVLHRYPDLDDGFWEGLRALATNLVGGNLAFVVASHEPLQSLASRNSLGSPFFNIFAYRKTLGPLTEQETRELIASAPIAFPGRDVEWIMEQSGNWPALVQILCRERLAALEEGSANDNWRQDGLEQIAAFSYLLQTRQ
jgi:transcriptional regulator with XRE-family HTH domain